MTEKELQAAIIELGGYLGWAHYHTHDSRRSPAGFPDLVMVRDRVIFAELKAARGKTTYLQDDWRTMLEKAGAEYYLWRPEHWRDGSIEAVLRDQMVL